MGQIKANIERVVQNIGKNVSFMQPVYEAIANSLEANAKNIEIVFYEDNTLDGQRPGLINGFKIVDDGDGFDDFNIEGFSTLWTDNKIQIGCKGSGRFTWLSVYKHIEINSKLAVNKEKISFVFDYNFDPNLIKKDIDCTIEKNETSITFRNLTEKFRKENSGQLFADLRVIKKLILDYLVLKFFLLKIKSFDFKIILKNETDSLTICWDDIPSLESKNFTIKGIDDIQYPFSMYYFFTENEKNSKKMHFCACNRCIKDNDDDDLKFSCSFPDSASLDMMVCSKYLDDRNGDDRSTFEVLNSLKSANLLNPVTLSQIKKESIKVMNEIILERYPNIEDFNVIEVNKAIEEVPYLSKYIMMNDDIVKSSQALVKKAISQHAKEKEIVKENFAKALKDRNINPEQFNQAVKEMSDIAAVELGEYILYRDSVIDGLKEGIKDKNTKESFVHNIIIPMHSALSAEESEEKKMNNIWLFDDKFMTFSYCASDKTILQIVKSFYPDKDEAFYQSKRPDIFLAFDKDESSKKRNAVMIEIKGPNADIDEKNKSITELSNHIDIIRKNIPEIETIWGYIITTIDDEFKRTLDIQETFIPLFSKDIDGRAYYGYFKKVNAHIYAIDLNVVLDDAKLRNKTFMDLLKNK